MFGSSCVIYGANATFGWPKSCVALTPQKAALSRPVLEASSFAEGYLLPWPQRGVCYDRSARWF
jgi:hypothetical protein